MPRDSGLIHHKVKPRRCEGRSNWLGRLQSRKCAWAAKSKRQTLGRVCVPTVQKISSFSIEAGTPGKEFAEHGYEATREAAMAAFAKSWRRE